MNAICGVLHFDGRVDPVLLRAQTESMRLCRSGEAALWRSDSVGLANLPIDQRSEAQLVCKDGLVVTAGARLDDRDSLFSTLGIPPARHCSDAELILCAYQRWGTDCVDHLIGDFSFAIWDTRNRQLFCARDHMGIKPFFYAVAGAQFAFSNQLHCLEYWPQLQCETNDLAIADFLLFGFGHTPDPEQTAVNPVRRVLAGHALLVRASSGQMQVKIWRHWNPLRPSASAKQKDALAYAEEFKAVLERAVRDRVRGCERVGVMMSGGLDSPSIAALARGYSDCRAYTIVHEQLIRDDEPQVAKFAARAFAIKQECIVADSLRLFDGWNTSSFQAPEPHEGFFLEAEAQLFRSASGNSDVLLSGNGGDVVLAAAQGHWKAAWATKGMGATLGEIMQYSMWMRRLPRLGVRSAIRRSLARRHPVPQFPAWISPALERSFDLRDRWHEWHLRQRSSDSAEAMIEELREPYWGRYFEFYSEGVSRLPVAVSYPFMDLRVIEFALSVQAGPWSFDKLLLRLAMREELPKRVRLRPKKRLQEDPIRARLARDWNQVVGFKKIAELDGYVDFKRLPSLREIQNGDAGLHLRPFCLGHWLQSKNVRAAVAN